MAEREEKYIVVKIKDLERLKEKGFDETLHPERQKTYRKMLSGFEHALIEIGNENRYLCVNLDEPYAEAMYDILIAFENLKEQLPTDAPFPPQRDEGETAKVVEPNRKVGVVNCPKCQSTNIIPCTCPCGRMVCEDCMHFFEIEGDEVTSDKEGVQ